MGRSTAMYAYRSLNDGGELPSPRRALVATLVLAGLRVSELCALDKQDVDLPKGKIYVRDSKTEAGVRVVDIRPRLLDELRAYAAGMAGGSMGDPFFPTRTGRRRDRKNVLSRVVERGLVADGRLGRFTAVISDRPGGLADLASQIASAGASVKQVVHDRAFAGSDVSAVHVLCTVETRNHAHLAELRARLKAHGVRTFDT